MSVMSGGYVNEKRDGLIEGVRERVGETRWVRGREEECKKGRGEV